ncbi:MULTISPECIES: ECF subfamily RNA polymerase sigma factor, BldN family [Streptomyces]|uniref:RNA polymerase sigma factor n=1 Tax=Streptomyces noursei TaxID=1971 RepID=A0A059W570_STRNR|nr:ECF subfamily RNA polymerase sigma factor, BldN family [Streptomyces noursei]AKA04659.1 RNA polymerase subunit sigma-24 [Streptomyces noursei ZPM]AIA04458.1 ECF subfamily RNA polymerase sigma factor [Streptomyces noursei]EOT05050.1 RNA polymerase subunit sigma-24 [Streptomyces noursei CCRC 11814]EXU90224.1 RNA polymerase subunit sigma-24 [Streptomyces noursei PD-1]MCE4947854.1 sigma-70 family RNA polymerase sigma factor [Streptomyces noursei]
MYPHVGVDASGLATLRTTLVDHLRSFVPTAYAVPAFATAVPTGPCYALADGSAAVGKAATAGRTRRAGTGTTTARRPADSDSRRMMDLVERAQAGEADAFGRLYDQYADTVYRYIYYRVGGRATAEDLTSETFLRALRRIGTFTWQGRDFGAWLVTIARNLVADHFKSSRFRLEVTTGEMLDANEVERSPEDSVLESLSNAALLEAVRKLNPQQQECVTLRFLQGLSVAETARVMGKNEGAIKTLQYRAVRTLARLLPDDAR